MNGRNKSLTSGSFVTSRRRDYANWIRVGNVDGFLLCKVETYFKENNTLLYGAFGWLVGSALIIASYRWGWQFLYIGPIVCLLGPLVPILAMKFDIGKYRQILAQRQNTYRNNH